MVIVMGFLLKLVNVLINKDWWWWLLENFECGMWMVDILNFVGILFFFKFCCCLGNGKGMW